MGNSGEIWDIGYTFVNGEFRRRGRPQTQKNGQRSGADLADRRPSRVPAETPTTPTEALRVSCTTATGDDGEITVRVVIENVSDATLHIFDRARMPYLLEEDGTLVILYGVNPPDPNREYFVIEIPSTQALPPGARVEDEVSLTPLRLGDHYSLPRERNSAVTRHGAVTVRCEVGWGQTPILPAPEEEHVRNIDRLLAWQQLSRAEAIQVEFP